MTLAKFKELRKDPDGKNGVRMSDDSKRGVKRKRGEMDEYMASNFNPKYLTSRDLFELEVGDDVLY
jgi:THO complex subunit 1